MHRRSARIAVTAKPVAWFDSRLLALVILALAVLVAGCDGLNDERTVASQSADATHAAWIEAVRDGDADAALALLDPQLSERDQFAREAVTRMQDYLTSPASPTGALQNIAVEPVVDGTGQSVWQFAHKRWCYRTELVSRSERWYVSRWGQTSVNCS